MHWEQWIAFEQDLNEHTGLNSCVIDHGGVRISAYRKWANPLCPLIRHDQKGRDAICDLNQALLQHQAPEGEIVVSRCPAGMVVLCLPVCHKGEQLGLIGGCGLLPEHGQVDKAVVGRATGLSASRIDEMSRGVGRLLAEDIVALGHYLKRQLHEVIETNVPEGG